MSMSIILFANSGSFTSFFLLWMPFTSSFLIGVMGTSSAVLNESGEGRYPCPVSDVKGNPFTILPIEYGGGCRFVIYILYYVKVCSLYSLFAQSFYHKWVLDFVKYFFCNYYYSCTNFTLYYIYVVYHIDFQIL